VIARLRAAAGQHQIAKPESPAKSRPARQGGSEPSHLGEPAGNQRGAGIVAEAASVDDAGRRSPARSDPRRRARRRAGPRTDRGGISDCRARRRSAGRGRGRCWRSPPRSASRARPPAAKLGPGQNRERMSRATIPPTSSDIVLAGGDLDALGATAAAAGRGGSAASAFAKRRRAGNCAGAGRACAASGVGDRPRARSALRRSPESSAMPGR